MAQEQDGIKFADDAIKSSKAALAKAVKFNGPVKPMKPTKAAPVAETPKPKSSGLLYATGHSEAPALKAKTDQIEAYEKAVPKMHKGGEVMEDGVKNLQKGEVVVSKEKAEEGKKIMGLKEKAKGPMSKAMEEEDNEPKSESKKESKKDEKKEEKKDGEKKAKKPVKKVKGMHVRQVHGGFIAKHDMEPAEPGAAVGPQQSEEHALPDMAALQDHMAQHMGEEPSAAAPAAEAAPAQV